MIETIESEYIHDGNAENFPQLVIENSKLGPVLLNFWSRTAGPCLRQYPILDKLIHTYDGRLLLINIDIEKEIQISKNYGIASVPTLKLIRFGDVVVTLHGYQNESDLHEMLEMYVTRESDKIIEQAVQEYSQGNHEKSYQLLSDAIVDDQINPRLPLMICKLLKHEKRFTEAYNLLDVIPEKLQNELEILKLSNQLFFDMKIESVDDLDEIIKNENKNLPDLTQIQILSAYYVIEQNYESALLQLEKIINLNHKFDESYARKAMLKIFNIIGDDNNLAQKFRPLLLKYSH
ncbi:MAG: tetratricopeptide repeat protein [Gammaproteobacteria bacterium]